MTEPAPSKARRLLVPLAIAVVLVVAAVVLTVSILQRSSPEDNNGGRDQNATPSPSPAPSDSAGPSDEPTTGAPPATGPGQECATDGVTVSTAEQLEDALAAAAPGDSIRLSPGTYRGHFSAETSGTPDAPITLCGSADSILDGGGIRRGYVLHLDNVSNWVLRGFTVQNGQKGVMADGTTGSLIENLTVTETGDEAIHLRDFSTDNTVSGNTISHTGNRKPKFGEGIYLGTAESNWCDVSDCEPDRSDRNVVTGNRISATSSESIDIKEGTSGGIVRDNEFDGSAILDADSWVDVKGNGYLIEGNTGVNSPGDGFQTHEIIDGWGTDNVFSDNHAEVNGPGFGFSLTPVRGNVVHCSNTASDAVEGTSNTPCMR
jgi:parallel beta-helix repeat protein